MSTTLTMLDERLKMTVMNQLAWDPEVDASLIGVTAKEGIVTLSGYVDTYGGKLAAERATRRVYGVKAVANELEVKLSMTRIDPDIAKDALEALKNRIDVPLGIAVTVRDGYVTLTGKVEWMFQKLSAERAVKYIRGVRGVLNYITLKPAVSPKDVQKRITEALHRHADLDARRIHIDAEGPKVILTGTVRSWTEKDEVQRAAWRAPGVETVDNRINVVP
ncbi:MAG TPA: BON domain-containing protein [Vicinamibacterales bacterium]|jgi:osmotically-inducible protein OsmY